MYELSQRPNRSEWAGRELGPMLRDADDAVELRLVWERLIALRLVGSPRTDSYSPSASILTPMMPHLLSHLNPAVESPLPAYHATYLSSLFLPLPTTALHVLVTSLTQHLVLRLDAQQSFHVMMPRQDVKRATMVLEQMIGPAKLGSDAYDEIARNVVHSPEGRDKIMSGSREMEIRVMVAWLSRGHENGQSAKWAVFAFTDVEQSCGNWWTELSTCGPVRSTSSLRCLALSIVSLLSRHIHVLTVKI